MKELKNEENLDFIIKRRINPSMKTSVIKKIVEFDLKAMKCSRKIIIEVFK